MKKYELIVVSFISLFFLVKCGNIKKCKVNKIASETIFRPSWTGECVNDSAVGNGILFDYSGSIRYSGEMKSGFANGFGTYFGKYIVSGKWNNGIPIHANYYLREVKFSLDYQSVFIENGVLFKVKDSSYSLQYGVDNYHFIDSLLATIDSINFSQNLENDTLFHTNGKKNRIKPVVDSLACVKHIFFLGSGFDAGWSHSNSYDFFVVQCNSGVISRFYNKNYHFKGGSIRSYWKMNSTVNSPISNDFSNPFELLKHVCNCDENAK